MHKLRKKTPKYNYIAIAILALFMSCTFEEPTLPTWFAIWRFPIPDPGFEVSKIINDSTIVDTTDDGNHVIAISIEDSLDKQQVPKSDLAIKPDNDSLTQDIGDISLDSPPSEVSDPITAEEILGIQLTPDTQIDIPETDVDAPSRYLVFKDFFRVVNVKDGFMQVQFFNETFLNIRDSMTISIYDSTSMEYLGDALFPQAINSNSSAVSQPVDLNGKTFTNVLRFDATLPIAEEQGHTLTEEDVISSLYFTATLSEMEVAYAHAMIPEQEFSEYDSTSVEDEEDKMISAKIDEGEIILHIDNQLPVTANVTVELLNFYFDSTYTPESVFDTTYQLTANSSDIVPVSLDGLYITRYKNGPTFDENIIKYFKYNVAVNTLPSEDYVEISEDDPVIVKVEVADSIYVEQFKGIIAPVEVTFDPQEQNDVIESEGFEGSIYLDELTMELQVYNEIGMDLRVDLNITGYKNNRTESIRLQFMQNPFIVHAREEGEFVHVTTVLLDSSNSNIVDFVKFLPEDIINEGIAVVNPEEEIGEVTKHDQVWADYHIYTPFYFRIEDNSKYRSEIDSNDVAQDIRDAVLEGNIRHATVNLNIINGLPIGAQFILYASSNYFDLYDPVIIDSSQKWIINDVQFPAGIDQDNDGFVDDLLEEPVEFELNRQQLEIFANERVYIATEVLLDNTETLVKLRQTDKLQIIGQLQMRYRMNNK